MKVRKSTRIPSLILEYPSNSLVYVYSVKHGQTWVEFRRTEKNGEAEKLLDDCKSLEISHNKQTDIRTYNVLDKQMFVANSLDFVHNPSQEVLDMKWH